MHLNLMAPVFPQLDVNIPEGWWKQDAQLDLDFANKRAYNKSTQFRGRPDNILTYSAPSPKMVYGDDGVLRYAPHNLFSSSEDITPFLFTNATKISATTFTFDTAAGYARRSLTVAQSQFKVKVVISGNTPGDTFLMELIDVADGSDAAATVATISTAPQEFTITANMAVSTFSGYLILALNRIETSRSVTVGSSVTIHSVHLFYYPCQDETYIPTTSAAVYSLPIDHDPITHAPLGVLIEEQRTNLLTYSEQFDNAAWTKTGSSISANAVASPDGTTIADKIVENSANSTHGVSVVNTGGAASTTSVFSIYAKAGERTKLRILNTDNATGGVEAVFDLSAGTVGAASTSGNYSSGSASIQDVGNEWYRCIVIATKNGSGNTSIVPIVQLYTSTQTYLGDGVSGAYVWGAQVEQNVSFATSYIPTVASQVTRAADQVSILTSAFPYNVAAGTVYAEADSYNANGTTWALSDGTANERIVSNTGATYHLGVFDGGVEQTSIDVGTVPTDGTKYKCAAAFAADDFGFSLDGGAVGTDTGGTLPTVTSLRIGMGASTTTVQLNGHIKRLTYFSTRKTNAELQGLTI